jgi:nucleoside-diphosphate-sugar epimerase
VVDAICAAARQGLDGGLNLAGPESLTREDLYKRAAAVLGRSTSVRSVPVFVGYAIAWLLELFSAEPPITRAMLGVLDHDDQIDVAKAQQMLGLHELTDLDTMLRKTIL